MLSIVAVDIVYCCFYFYYLKFNIGNLIVLWLNIAPHGIVAYYGGNFGICKPIDDIGQGYIDGSGTLKEAIIYH